MTMATTTKRTLSLTASGAALFLSGCGLFTSELRTEIPIEAPAESVWNTLIDFEQFPVWNPMIRRADGSVIEGASLSVFVQPPGAKGMAFAPTVTRVEPNRELRWLGKLGIRGLFDGEHIFTIESTSPESVRFIHRERFSGALIPLMMPFIRDDTLRGFREMNVALKARVEGGE